MVRTIALDTIRKILTCQDFPSHYATSVGWVERSETHQFCNIALIEKAPDDGFRLWLYPSYDILVYNDMRLSTVADRNAAIFVYTGKPRQTGSL